MVKAYSEDLFFRTTQIGDSFTPTNFAFAVVYEGSITKGSNYPYNSAVEFDTDLTPETFDIDQINQRLDYFILQDIPLASQVVSTSSEDYLNSFRTEHFDEGQHPEVRLVKIGDFLSYACG